MSEKRSQANASKAMKEELLKWICMSHATNSPLNRNSLRTKALELVDFFGLKGFKCSEAWITVFLKRYGFSTNLNDCSGPVFEDYRVWIDLIRPLFMEYNYENQFHVDELMMYTDFLPSVTRKPKDNLKIVNDDHKDQTSFISPAMNRVSLLLACNVSGTQKLRPLICGPYNLEERQDRLYYQTENSKISDELFGSWLLTLNRDMALINRNIVLMMSRKRVNALNNLELTHIMPLFIPNEYPAKLKPFRTDVFHYIKMSYRKEYVELLCKAPSKALGDPEEIIDTLIESWKEVSRELIVTNFQRTKFREDDSFLNIECESWNNLMTGVPFEKFVTFDDGLIDITDTGLNNLEFLSSIKENDTFKSSLSYSSKNNDEEQSEISTGDLDESLKRPSDDSLYMSDDLQEQSCKNAKDISSLRFQELNDNNNDQCFSILHSIKGLHPEKLLNTGKRMQDIPVRIMDTLCKTQSSPIRSTSTPIKDYEKEINRIYLSSKRASVIQTHSDFINDGCFEEVTKCLESKVVNLEKSPCHLHGDSPRNNIRSLLNNSPIPSTSKEGLEESYILQQLHERFKEVNFYDKMNLKEDRKSPDSLILEKRNQKNENRQEQYMSFKRKKGDNSLDVTHDNDEPDEKKIKMESNWAKQYENHRVFGPNMLNQSEENLAINANNISFEAQDIEKKCIFSFSQNPGSPKSY
ncbi:tigger transposable element-derived protein 4-like [Chelonus insularis]|uniref:tigger transposable element-derived protein 4-like n=1 Tax=Chelonus insularis TaxID=460826 RepID=UPI0015889C97|nr:tigger transposable element-derived protein 4-like [Chelonus insularis]